MKDKEVPNCPFCNKSPGISCRADPMMRATKTSQTQFYCIMCGFAAPFAPSIEPARLLWKSVCQSIGGHELTESQTLLTQ